MKTVGIAVISLDGYITKHQDEGIAFASEEDQRFFKEALQEFDCCIFGSKTFLASQSAILENRSSERLRIVLTHSPDKYTAYQRPEQLEFSSKSPQEIVIELQTRKKTHCALLGGGEIYTLFLRHNLIDELWLTIEAKLFGNGKKLITHEMDISLLLKELVYLSKDTLLLKYLVKRDSGKTLQ